MKALPRLSVIFLFPSLFILHSACQPRADLTPDEAREIAEEAYIYAYPMLEHYKMMFAQAMYPESGAFEAPFNTLHNKTQLLGPEYTTIVRPNNDTFYSIVWFNLKGEPMVLRVPAIADGRYYSFQIIDLNTYNIDYIGTRATGFDAGAFLFAGPDWAGETPEGIEKVIRSDGNFLVALGRTQVFGPQDVEKAREVMAGYAVEPLSVFLGEEGPASAPEPPTYPPFDPEKVNGVGFIAYLNALLGDARVQPSEKEMLQGFGKIGIGPGKSFDRDALDPAIVDAIKEGIRSAQARIAEESTKLGDRQNGWQLIRGAFGTRAEMEGKYLTRAAAAYFGLWGNSMEEAYYPEATVDADGDPLDGSKHNYLLHFEADEIPPVKAFWSLSMYKLPEQLFIENEIDRYVIGSATDGLKYHPDGSLDIFIQKDNPGPGKVSNWLPAFDGPFSLQARMYWPEPGALDPLYVPPPVQKVE